MDVYPANVKGPHTHTRSRVVTQARIFTHDGRLFVAESRNRGADVTRVTAYPIPDGDMVPDPRRGKAGRWGDWSWSSCGCSSRWGRHTVETLAALAEPTSLDAPESSEPAPEPVVVEGSI